MENRSHNRIADFSKHLFWDVDPSKLDLNKNKKLIIERVIQRGSRNDLNKLLSSYNRSEIREVLTQIGWLSEKDLAFVHVFFDIPYNELKCYSKRPFNRYY